MNLEKEKFISCGKCNNGYIKTIEKGSDVIRRCKCRIEYERKAYANIKLYNANIPPATINYQIESYIGPDENKNIPKLIKFVDQFENKFKDKILYMYGEIETQKTTLAYWIGKQLLGRGFSVQYTLMNQLMIELQDDRFKEEIDTEKYKSCDCLIIDRAFESSQLTLYKSGYQISFIDTFLRSRIDMHQQCIIFVSNVPYNEISKHGFNKDIESLITRKVKPYNMALHFKDRYDIEEMFTDLWSDNN